MSDDIEQRRADAEAAVAAAAVERRAELAQQKDSQLIAYVLAERLRVHTELSGTFENALSGYSLGMAEYQHREPDHTRGEISQAYNRRYQETPGQNAQEYDPQTFQADRQEADVNECRVEAFNLCHEITHHDELMAVRDQDQSQDEGFSH